MKKLIVLFGFFAALSIQAQHVSDDSISTYINSNIIPNAANAITAAKMNHVLDLLSDSKLNKDSIAEISWNGDTLFLIDKYNTPDTFILVSASDSSHFTRSGNYLFPENSTDSVGIGTGSPDEKLVVVGNFQLDDGATRFIQVGTSPTTQGNHLVIKSGAGTFDVTDASGNIYIYTPNDDTDGNVLLNVDESGTKTGGYVGVGVAVPGHPLDVDGTIRGNGSVIFSGLPQRDSANYVLATDADTVVRVTYPELADTLTKGGYMPSFDNVFAVKKKASLSPLYIALFGDSNTKMYESTTLSYDGGYGGWESYAAWLNYFAANRPYMYDATIDKAGRIGARAYNAIDVFNDSVSTSSNIIVLSFGTNDVRTSTQTVSTYIANMEILLDSVDVRGALPIVLGIPYTGDTTQSRILDFTEALDSLCQSRGVKYVDTYYLLLDDTVTYFTEPSGSEKIHYSDKGARLVAEALVKALDEVFGYDGSGNRTYYKENWSDENPIIFYNNAMIDKYLDDTCFYSGYYEDSIISRLCWNGFRLETGDSIQFRTDGRFCFGFYALDGDTTYLEWKVSQRWRDNNDTIYTYYDTVTSGMLLNENGTDAEQDWKLHRISHGDKNIYNDVTLKVTGDNIFVRTFSTDKAVWSGGSFANIKMTGNIEIGAFTALGYVASTSFRLGNGGNATMTGTNNYMLGSQSFYSNTSGSNNIGIGFQAGYANTTASRNIYIGYGTANENDDSEDNIGIGHYALRYLNAASGSAANTAIGSYAGEGATSSTTGLRNTFVGAYAGTDFTTADRSIMIGYAAGFKTTTGDYNTMIGYQSGYNNVSGASNVFLGYQSGLSETGSNKLYIENSNSTTPLIYGDFANDYVNINGSLSAGSLGRSPAVEFEVNGDAIVSDTLSVGHVLKLIPAADPPASPEEGMIYADTDHHIYYYNGSTWVQLDN